MCEKEKKAIDHLFEYWFNKNLEESSVAGLTSREINDLLDQEFGERTNKDTCFQYFKKYQVAKNIKQYFLKTEILSLERWEFDFWIERHPDQLRQDFIWWRDIPGGIQEGCWTGPLVISCKDDWDKRKCKDPFGWKSSTSSWCIFHLPCFGGN